jgi:hypothetical protein
MILAMQSQMTLTSLFKYLNAPLTNQRWSWGAARASDGAVFLRVWQDEIVKSGQRRLARVTANAVFAGNEADPGYAERLRHVELIRNGAKSYMIVCAAVDVHASPRAIATFNEKEVFVGGTLAETNGEWWLELVSRQPVQSVRARPANPAN